MSFESQRSEIIDIGKKLLQDGTVKVVLGFANGEVEGISIPRFFRSPEELNNLKWDKYCSTILAKYLLGRKDKTAILAKPCDVRAIVMYLVEKQINRDNVYIIGVECGGMAGKDGSVDAVCRECSVKVPPIYDVLVKGSEAPAGCAADEDSEKKIQDLNHNLVRFQNEMKKCILCYTCRQACYGCYCQTCFVDRNIPDWMPPQVDMGSKVTFHLGRAMHLAGRCVECGACERACPSGVNIRYLIKEINNMCKDLYGYSAGMDPDERPAIANFKMDDREVGFLGGDADESCCHSQK